MSDSENNTNVQSGYNDLLLFVFPCTLCFISFHSNPNVKQLAKVYFKSKLGSCLWEVSMETNYDVKNKDAKTE